MGKMMQRLTIKFILFFIVCSGDLQAMTNQKVSHPLSLGQRVARNPVFTSADRIVYGVNEQFDNVYTGIFSVDFRMGPSSVTNLNGPMIPGGTVRSFSLSSNGNQVVFTALKEGLSSFELYSVPTGGGPTTKLNGPLLPSQDVFDFLISPDQDTDTISELFSVSILGGPNTKLNGLMAGDVAQLDYKISPDSSRVVYRADQDTLGIFELYSVPLAGGGVTKLNPPLVLEGDIAPDFPGVNFLISPDGSRVVYRADQETDGVIELYNVPIIGGAGVKLNTPNIGNVANFLITPDGNFIVYLVGNPFGNLFSVPIMGGASTQINGAGGGAGPVQISPDSSRVIYNADTNANSTFELYSVSLSGGPVVKLGSPSIPHPFFVVSQISPDSSRVVFHTDQTIGNVFELYSIPIAGGPTTKLNGPLFPNGDVGTVFDISPDGNRVIYTAHQDTNAIELYSVSILGGTTTKLNGPLVSGGNVSSLSPISLVHPSGGPIIYEADQDTNDVRELYITLNPPIITSPTNVITTVGTNFNYTITADNGPIIGYGASNLPAWASLNSNLISGVPNIVGTNFITLSATNVDGVGSAVLRLIVNLANGGTNNMLPPVITSPLNVTNGVGANFNYTITADNGPITGFGAANLPSWAILNNDTISGVPDAVGVFAINLFATNNIGFDNKILNLTITPANNNTNQPPPINNVPESITGFNADLDGDGTLDLVTQKKKTATLIAFKASGIDTSKTLALNKKDKIVGANVINSNNALIVQNKTVIKAILIDSNFTTSGNVTLGSVASTKTKVVASGDINGDSLVDVVTQQGKTIGVLLSPNYTAATLVSTKKANPKVVGMIARIGAESNAVSSLVLAKGKKLFFYDIPTNVPFIVGEGNEPKARDQSLIRSIR
jgi:dipeptidyl aminopeptidase/acylaminoacyl peptidase